MFCVSKLEKHIRVQNDLVGEQNVYVILCNKERKQILENCSCCTHYHHYTTAIHQSKRRVVELQHLCDAT